MLSIIPKEVLANLTNIHKLLDIGSNLTKNNKKGGNNSKKNANTGNNTKNTEVANMEKKVNDVSIDGNNETKK